MRYEHVVKGKARDRGPRMRVLRKAPPEPKLRRFPPVLQVITQIPPYVEQQLSAIALQAHRQGKDLSEVCRDIHYYAQSLGFTATIGMREVYSADMPSFPGQTVVSALLMVDLKPLAAQHRPARPHARAAG